MRSEAELSATVRYFWMVGLAKMFDDFEGFVFDCGKVDLVSDDKMHLII